MTKHTTAKITRNSPQQSRSRATVAAILDGMVRVLDQDGLEAATTTRVAQVAGVSVGTLYQYFSNRDSILFALQDREFERATDMMHGVLGGAGSADGREIAKRIIEGLLRLYAVSPALHRTLVVEGLRVTPTNTSQEAPVADNPPHYDRAKVSGRSRAVLDLADAFHHADGSKDTEMGKVAK